MIDAGHPPYPGRGTRRGLHREVVQQLGLRIVRGEYQPGQVLARGDELAASMGVSRTVLREAMKVLADKGLVESRPRAGTRVRGHNEWNLVDPDVIAWRRQAGPDLDFLRHLTEVRLVVETDAARLAALRADPQDLATIRGHLRTMERVLSDVDEYATADLELHGAILRATRNPLLAQLADSLAEGLAASREVTRHRPGGHGYSLPLHVALVEAIEGRDGRRAARVMANLVTRSLDDIEMVLGPPAQVRASRGSG